MEIRKARAQDYGAIRRVHDLAFGQVDEGNIVAVLSRTCHERVSLVAVSDGDIVGHILFSPVTVGAGERRIKGMGLAPMAVLPDFQNQGIGSLLVEEGIRQIKQTGYPYIIVLGHAHYYPRFGFERASIHGLRPQWQGVPDAAFMVKIVDLQAMAGVAGMVMFRPEFEMEL